MSTTISAKQVQELREQTGLPMMEVKKALVEAAGDATKALQVLKERGHATAAKRADRSTHEGTIGTYLHSNKKLFAGVSLLCETDFVAKGELFQDVAHRLAMHVAATAPTYVAREDVPAELVDAERATIEKQLANEGKPAAMFEKIVPGKLNSFFQAQCLMEQTYALDPDVTIAAMITELVQKVGENVRVGAIYRWTV